MGTDKEIRSNFYSNNFLHDGYFIRRCTLEDLEGVIAVNEKELPEDYPYFFYKNILDNYSDSFLVALMFRNHCSCVSSSLCSESLKFKSSLSGLTFRMT